MKHIWQGKWIGAEMTVEERFAPIFKKEFTVCNVKSAKIFISGLGLFELKINGSLPDDTVLNPAHSQYNQTVFYRIFNITSFIKDGTNTVTVEVGHSFFNETTGVWDWDTAPWREYTARTAVFSAWSTTPTETLWQEWWRNGMHGTAISLPTRP